jgi:holliday junction DNA helicase RuvA
MILQKNIGTPSTTHDAISALISLGYKPLDANRIINQHKDKNLSSEELIRLALKELA